MELKWLEDFICLANTGSFSKAAESRHVTQSAFSRRIKALEEWLGTTLIDRNSYPVKLTEEGARFVETAQQSVRLFHKVRSDFSQTHNNKRKSLSFGIADHLLIHFFPAWLRSIEQALEPYYFDLSSGIKSGVSFFESLRLQEFDFLICYRGTLSDAINTKSLDMGNFETLVLGHESLVPVCETQRQRTQGYQLPPKDNTSIPYVSYRRYSALRNEILAITSGETLPPVALDAVIESSSAESIKSFVLQGFGIAWLPESAVEEELRAGTLVRLSGEHYHVPLDIEIHRYTPNTKPENIAFWRQLIPLCQP